MKHLLVLASIVMLSNSAFAQTISTGCFHYGPNNCDIQNNPPSIDLGGFHMGEVNPNPPTNAKFFIVQSTACSNGIGPKFTQGQRVEFGSGVAAVVVGENAYLVGSQRTASGVQLGQYVNPTEFEVTSFQQQNGTNVPVASLNIQFNAQKVVITSQGSQAGVCELIAE